MTYLFLSFNSDSINTVCLSWNIKVFPKISQFGRDSAFFLVIFGKLLRACFIVLGPAKLKIVRVRSVLNDVSVPFASCPPNRRHSEYYSCQTVQLRVVCQGRFLSDEYIAQEEKINWSHWILKYSLYCASTVQFFVVYKLVKSEDFIKLP